MKATLTTLMLALLIIPAEARRFLIPPAARVAARIEARQEAKEKLAREHRHDAVQKLIDKKDSNHDDSLSKAEYISNEPDKKAAEKSSTSITRTATSRYNAPRSRPCLASDFSSTLPAKLLRNLVQRVPGF